MTERAAKNLSYLVFTLFVFLLYSNTLFHGFVLDDSAVLTQNKIVQKGISGIPEILTTDYWAGYWTTNTGVYRPVPLIYFAVGWTIFGNNPLPYHLINIVLYALTACVLFQFLLRVFNPKNPIIPLVAVLVFIAHPLHTEVVANIKSADELISFLFILGALLAWIKAIEKKSILQYCLATLFFFLALLSKETAVTFLAVFPLVYFFKFHNSTGKKMTGSMLPLIVITGVYFILRKLVLGANFTRQLKTHAENSFLDANSISERIASSLSLFGEYLKKLIFPVRQSFDYSYNQIPIASWSEPMIILSLLVLIALAYYGITRLRRREIIAWAVLYFFITYSIVSNSIILINTTFADRLMYVPSVGICLALSVILFRRKKTDEQLLPVSVRSYFSQNKIGASITIILLVAFSFKSISRNEDWKDNYTLFSQDVKNAPLSWKTHYLYGSELLQQYFNPSYGEERKLKLLEQSIAELKESLTIDSSLGLQYSPLGHALYLASDFSGSASYLEKYLSIFPSDTSLSEYLGYALARSGQFEKAIQTFEKHVQSGHQSADVYQFLGLCQMETKKYAEAIHSFSEALRARPNDENLLSNLAAAYGNAGNVVMANESYKKVLRINPNNPIARSSVSDQQ